MLTRASEVAFQSKGTLGLVNMCCPTRRCGLLLRGASDAVLKVSSRALGFALEFRYEIHRSAKVCRSVIDTELRTIPLKPWPRLTYTKATRPAVMVLAGFDTSEANKKYQLSSGGRGVRRTLRSSIDPQRARRTVYTTVLVF